jgi:hypothetical protein
MKKIIVLSLAAMLLFPSVVQAQYGMGAMGMKPSKDQTEGFKLWSR